MSRESKTLTNMVYEQVYADVVNAKLGCNDLITEAKLAEQLQVSKAPIREALLMLCQENVLRTIPRMGYLVKHIPSPT